MRLIDADALLNELGDIWNIPKDWDGDIDETCETAFDVIENAPTVEAKPVVHGKWKHRKNWDRYVCSVCSHEHSDMSNFCEHCGADMRGEKRD